MQLIELKKITKNYSELNILNEIDFSLESGKSYAVTGKSGTGKSTLLHIAALLDSQTSGNVLINGCETSTLSDKKISQIRNKNFGFVFQDNFLLDDYTALENVIVPALVSGANKKKALSRAEELLVKIGLADRLKHKPNQMSGGEKQRVSICRALMNNPDVIFADEPTGALDEENAEIVENLLINIVAQENKALLLVTHNDDFAAKCDNVFVLKNHKLERNF